MARKRNPPLTSDAAVLQYLLRQDATHGDIAAALAAALKIKGSHHPSTRAVLARLHLRGEVEKQPATRAWNITSKGKKALEKSGEVLKLRKAAPRRRRKSPSKEAVR